MKNIIKIRGARYENITFTIRHSATAVITRGENKITFTCITADYYA